MKEMVRILCVEVDKSKMYEEEKESWGGLKDGEDEDEDVGDRVDQHRLASCFVGDGLCDGNGDGLDDGGCGSGGTLTAAMITSDEIRGVNCGAENYVENGVEVDNEVDLLDLDVVIFL